MTTIQRMLVAAEFAPEHLADLGELVRPGELVVGPLARAAERFDVIVAPGGAPIEVAALPYLRWLHVDGAGLDRYATPANVAAPVAITSASGRNAPEVAEHAFFFALALRFGTEQLVDARRGRTWLGPAYFDNRPSLGGSTLGVVGLGSIGAEMASVGRAFGMRIVGLARRPAARVPVDELFVHHGPADVRAMAAECDVLMLAASLNDTTYRMIDAAVLSAMRPDALLINVARAALVDHARLVDALVAGRLAGAGIDVFDPEPLPPDDPLWDAPNVLMTPHASLRRPDRRSRAYAALRDNVLRYLEGDELTHRLGARDLFSWRSRRMNPI